MIKNKKIMENDIVNLKSSRSEIKLFLKFTKKKTQTVSPIILAALWTMCILWTISVLL